MQRSDLLCCPVSYQPWSCSIGDNSNLRISTLCKTICRSDLNSISQVIYKFAETIERQKALMKPSCNLFIVYNHFLLKSPHNFLSLCWMHVVFVDKNKCNINLTEFVWFSFYKRRSVHKHEYITSLICLASVIQHSSFSCIPLQAGGWHVVICYISK